MKPGRFYFKCVYLSCNTNLQLFYRFEGEIETNENDGKRRPSHCCIGEEPQPNNSSDRRSRHPAPVLLPLPQPTGDL